MIMNSSHTHIRQNYRLGLGLALAAFCWSTKSLMIPWRSSFLLANSKTSSVLIVVRPAWRLKLSRSVATASSRRRETRISTGHGHVTLIAWTYRFVP